MALTEAPNPLPVLMEALKFHRKQSAFHDRKAQGVEAAIEALNGKELLLVLDDPKPGTIKQIPLPTNTTKGQLVEGLIRSHSFEGGITAVGMRKAAMQQGVKIAANFPYRQLKKLKKVWKDANGMYFHVDIVPPPNSTGSAKELTQ